MDFKKIIFLLICISICSCSEDTDITVLRNLQEYIDEISNVEEKVIFAYAANATSNTSLAHVVYYPEEGASEIRYYELTAATLDKTIFANYRRQSLVSTDVYRGKLQRFSRAGSLESWCLVTYVIQGVLRISEPIKVNNTSKYTAYSNDVSINYTTTIAPNFTWEDGARDESVLYF
jgi:hypothetical protein